MQMPHKHILLDALDQPIKLLVWTLPQWGVILLPLLLGMITDYFTSGLVITVINLSVLNRVPYLDKPRFLMALRYRFFPADKRLIILPSAEQEEFPK